MRYHFIKPANYVPLFGETYFCDHPVYDRCTVFKIENKGLAVIQQRFNKEQKSTYWSEIEPWIANAIYSNPNFKSYFDTRASEMNNGLYPTVAVRQIMWALKMKPLKKQRWETVFDRRMV